MAELLLADRLYIPTELVRPHRVEGAFERYVFVESMCARCPVYKNGERFSELCQPCDGFKGFYKTWSEVTIEDEDYYAVPAGDMEYIEEKLELDLEDHTIEDHRSDVKAKNPLTFTGKLFTGKELRNGKKSPNQVKMLTEFYKHKRGVLQSDPRTGKTLMGTHMICKYKRRFLIIAHEKQLLKQFYRTLLNFTNLRELRKKTGDKIAGIIENDKDWSEDWDIVFCTYQSFITKKGFKRVKKHLINKFGGLIVDECFPKGTSVLTEKGSKSIEDIKIGDKVSSYNHIKNKFELKQVLATNKTFKEHKMVKIHHEKGSLTVSSEHLIWCINRNTYIPAIQLEQNDELCYTTLVKSLT